MTVLSRRTFASAAIGAATVLPIAAAAQSSTPAASPAASAVPMVGGNLTIYCGRSESLVGPLLENITAATGVTPEVRYASTSELAAQILDEGGNTPAGLFFSQDAGALGALAINDRLTTLPDDVRGMVDPTLQDAEGRWIGVSGRARVVVFQPDLVEEADIPASIIDLPTSGLGPIGFAPTNASFQTFITALRLTEGEDGARTWLENLLAADHIIYESNGPTVDAVGAGEAALGLVNHYYLYEKQAENPALNAQNHYYTDGDIGGMINIAGVGIIKGTDQEAQADAVVRYLLSAEAQHYFAETTFEYPLASGVSPVAELPSLAEYTLPDVNLNDLNDLEGTITLLTDLGLI